MIMDDPGTAQNAWLEHWHYPALSEEIIEEYLIKPLKEHNAILNINFVAGFVNDKNQWVEPAWTQQFVDEFGVKQDYVSSKRGYDEGVKLGVGDTRRHKEIPAAEQLWRMKTSKAWITHQFGVVPLQFCAGGAGASFTYHNNTFRLAGQAGFGWYGWSNGYLGKDMVIVGWDFSGTGESPLFIGAPPNGHDFGITKAPEKFTTIFKEYPGYRFMGINEFIGYLHAANSGQLINTETPKLIFTVDYDAHYCSFFKNYPSTWILELSDWVKEELGETPLVKVDGKPVPFSKTSFNIPIPEGIGEHYIEISKMK